MHIHTYTRHIAPLKSGIEDPDINVEAYEELFEFLVARDPFFEKSGVNTGLANGGYTNMQEQVSQEAQADLLALVHFVNDEITIQIQQQVAYRKAALGWGVLAGFVPGLMIGNAADFMVAFIIGLVVFLMTFFGVWEAYSDSAFEDETARYERGLVFKRGSRGKSGISWLWHLREVRDRWSPKHKWAARKQKAFEDKLEKLLDKEMAGSSESHR